VEASGGGLASQDLVMRERDGRIGYITISRPPLNILNIDVFDQLASALADLTRGDGVDIIILRSMGERAFSAGAEVAEHVPEKAPRMLEAFHRVARFLWSMDAVSVAAVRGLALGGGMELAMCCDIIVAAEDATFGQPEILLGSFPPVAAAVLPGRVGRHHAADIVLTGRRLSAFEALALGLVSRLAPPAEFEQELGRVIQSLRDNSGPVLRLAVRALRGAAAAEFSDALAVNEKLYVNELLALDDAREGIEAFLQKRKPRWKGAHKETHDR
jgi:cyclohexa-1,5-dienecarbonyl-CoA hydratase